MPTAIRDGETDAAGPPGPTGPKAKLSPQGMERVSRCSCRGGVKLAGPTIEARGRKEYGITGLSVVPGTLMRVRSPALLCAEQECRSWWGVSVGCRRFQWCAAHVSEPGGITVPCPNARFSSLPARTDRLQGRASPLTPGHHAGPPGGARHPRPLPSRRLAGLPDSAATQRRLPRGQTSGYSRRHP